MKIPVVAAGRGSPSVLSGQVEGEKPPETMIGLYKEGSSREPSEPNGVDWVGMPDRVESCSIPGATDSRRGGGIDSIHGHLCSDVVLVSAQVGGEFTWSDSERLFRELRGEGRLLLGVLAGSYTGRDRPDEGVRRRLRGIPDFFLPVNTPSVASALGQASLKRGPGRGVSQYLVGILRTLRARLRHSGTLTDGLSDLLEMTRREKLTLLKVGLARLLGTVYPDQDT